MENTYKVNKKAVEKIIERVYDNGSTVINKNDLEEMFPELCESEDERIRKALLELMHDTTGDELWVDYNVHKEDAIDWLEKQGEHSPVVIIPKFRVGDNIKTTNEEPLTITKIDDKGYWSEDLFICGFDDAAKWELVEQKPAWSEEDKKFINEIEESLLAYKIIVMDNDRELANYIEKEINWLKSLKCRVQPKQEWSKEDERYFNIVSSVIGSPSVQGIYDYHKVNHTDVSDWLEEHIQLQPKQEWKPSEEQMYNLSEAAHYNCAFFDMEILKGLYDDLKKLKGKL